MLKSAKVISDFVVADIVGNKKRKAYSYKNTKGDKKANRAIVYKMMQDLCHKLVKSSKMILEVRGRENLPKEGPVLYVATHKSVFDIVVLMTLIDDPAIYIGKKEVASMPFVNKWFDALGCIYVDREDMREALKSILVGIEEIKHGQSIVLFPEGTRQMSNEINTFKEGGFKLAAKTLVPIVPIALSNTYKVFEEKKRIQKTKVTVNIGEPIMTKELTKEELGKLASITQARVEELMAEIDLD